MGKFTDAKVRSLKVGVHADGDGLYLQVRDGGRRSWVLRYSIATRAHWLGLGAYPGTSLADAREAAGEARKALRAGVDPIAHRRAAQAKAAAKAGLHNFSEIADLYLKAHQAGWRSVAHREQWRTSLKTYAFPVLGKLGVAAIDTGAVMRVLEPIWRETPETASRVRGRIESVLDFATARGWRTGENPARWRGHLANLLPARAKVARVEHHAALPWSEIGAFMLDLAGQEGVAARALEFVILTAARSGEVLGARWSEIDLQAGVWVVPSERMKGGLQHRVPLSDATLAVLHKVAPRGVAARPDALVFGATATKTLSNNAMFRLLRQMDRGDLTTHGFRSAFRDWCGETGKASDIAEAALAHKLGNKVQAAYQRGDLLERRRVLMDQWATFCSRPAAAGGQVVPLRSAG